MRALDGVKVLDLSHAYNGPFCATWLADNGAEVIKIEPPAGDQCRTWGPMDEKSGESGYFAFLNRNKKGVTLNLKNERALQLFYKMVEDADVIIENFRVGVPDRLKIDYETVKRINPKIIYASGSGFGQYGPLSHRPCYDIVAQAMSGLVNLTGFPEEQGGVPTKVGPSIGDNGTGTFLCIGILLALYNREKTGKGQHVDVAMLDTLFSLLENAIVIQTMEGNTPQRQGNIDPSIAPFDIYKAKDGYIAMGVGNDKMFKVFCEAIGREDLVENPLYKTNVLRCENYVGADRLQGIISNWCANKSKFQIDEIMDKAGIPCGPVMDMKEAIENPQIQAREMMVHMDHPAIGPMYFQGCPVKLSETPGKVAMPAPMLGQHNKEIFHLTDEELKQYQEAGVL